MATNNQMTPEELEERKRQALEALAQKTGATNQGLDWKHKRINGKPIRKRIYEIVEASRANDKTSKYYDIFMSIVIFMSVLPLCFKYNHPILVWQDRVCMVIFMVDYALRWWTADYKLRKKHPKHPFLQYPFTAWAIIDLLSIVPTMVNIFGVVTLYSNLLKTLRVLRVFKVMRYSKTLNVISQIFQRSKRPLVAVFTLTIGYIIISAMFIFTVEPHSFDNFFEAIYWATVSLTTIGYGDIYPTTMLGKGVTIVSSIVGVAVFALPSGIITAQYLQVIEKDRLKELEQEFEKREHARKNQKNQNMRNKTQRH